MKQTVMKKKSPIDEFIALPDSEKERIVEEIEAETPEERLAKSRPLNARERAIWVAFQRKAARPKPGKNEQPPCKAATTGRAGAVTPP